MVNRIVLVIFLFIIFWNFDGLLFKVYVWFVGLVWVLEFLVRRLGFFVGSGFGYFGCW